MRRARLLLLVVAGIIVASCASLPPPSPSVPLVEFHIASVEVTGSGNVRSWPAEEEAFIRAHQLDLTAAGRIRTNPVSEDPALVAQAGRVLHDVFAAELRTATALKLAGPKPVRAVVHVSRFDVPSLARRMLTDQVASLVATVTLIEPGGQTVLASPEITVAQPLLGGLSSPVAALVENSNAAHDPGRSLIKAYAVRYVEWLAAN